MVTGTTGAGAMAITLGTPVIGARTSVVGRPRQFQKVALPLAGVESEGERKFQFKGRYTLKERNLIGQPNELGAARRGGRSASEGDRT